MKILMSAAVFASTAIWQISAQGLATGFAISEKYVLTAYDVVGNERSVQLRFGDDDWMRADYLDSNPDEGWCLLQLQGRAPSYVIVEDEEQSESGDEVYVFGAENGDAAQGRISFYDGDVVGVDKDSRCGSVIRHTVKLDKGALGAGLFSEEDNHVIGLIVGDRGRSSRMTQKAVSLYGNAAKIRKYVGQQEKTTRKTNRKAVCVIQSDMVESSKRGDRETRENPSNDTNTETFQRSRDSVATVECENSSGTGFVCEIDGKKYFVTNKHVASQRGRKIQAFFIDGKRLSLGRSRQ